ncbi:MAG TPA: methyltransferase domain-containing protein [Burkholderiales bacterium]|nr:methyltransferase domain-containing protein [Burkholderiales bacterium]
MRAALLPLLLVACQASADDADLRPPFITTPDAVVERMLELAGTRADDVVMDLGSGDGRIVIAAARKFGARGIGIELSPPLVEESRRNARLAGVSDRVSFVQGDVLLADISPASVVTLYLLPGLIGKLEPRFISELRPGTRIVAHGFAMAGWKPDRTEVMRIAQPHPGQGPESRLFLWIVPAEVRGTWRVDGREVRIEQNYQQIDVSGAEDARLSGHEISWRSREGRFSGRVEGTRMSGELVAPDGRRQALFLTR